LLPLPLRLVSPKFALWAPGESNIGRWWLAIGCVLFSLSAVSAAEHACNASSPCVIPGKDGGRYYLAFPKDWNGSTQLKPFVFFHGHGGSGAAKLRNKGLVRSLTSRNYLYIAPDGGRFNFRNRPMLGWAARHEKNPRAGRSDIRFVENVLADVARRFPVDLQQTIVSGFSSGGSMAWFFSCYSKVPLAGVIPIAGGLRRPLPGNDRSGPKRRPNGALTGTCPGGPRALVHVHSFSDRQVPLEGRAIRAWHQGDVFEGLAIQRNTNRCRSRPDKISTSGQIWCRSWTSCDSGKPVRFCLHAGGHGVPMHWPSAALKWIAPGKLPATTITGR